MKERDGDKVEDQTGKVAIHSYAVAAALEEVGNRFVNEKHQWTTNHGSTHGRSGEAGRRTGIFSWMDDAHTVTDNHHGIRAIEGSHLAFRPSQADVD